MRTPKPPMTVARLIELLRNYPPDMRVTLLDPDTDYLLPIHVVKIPASIDTNGVEFVTITGVYQDTLEGHGPHRS